MNKGQATLIGTILIILVAGAVFTLFFNYFRTISEQNEEIAELRRSAESAGDILLSDAYPSSWNVENVRKVGLLEEDILQMSNLEEFSKINYSRSKLLLGIKHDYLMHLQLDDGTLLPIPVPGGFIDFLGWTGITSQKGNGGAPFSTFFDLITKKTENLARTERFVTLPNGYAPDNKAKLILYTWSTILQDLGDFACSNSIDDDSDGFTDFPADPGCWGSADDDETDPSLDIQCNYSTVACAADTVELIRISGGLFGSSRHAASPGYSGYSGRICCGYANYLEVSTQSSCAGDPGSDVIGLSNGGANAHVQIKAPAQITYQNRTCLTASVSAGGNTVQCRFETSCSGGRVCAFSVSSESGAHIGGCDNTDPLVDYADQYCCKFT